MKMKNILNSLFPWLAVTTLLSLQGCENEEGTAIHSRDTVSFEIDAGGARATETTFETGDAIGVYAAVRMSSAPATLKTSGNYADNKRFVWNGSQFVADGDANEIAAGYETDYYAYYPYREDMGNPLDYDFSIQGDQREGITLSDFMYAANRSGTTDKVITLAFSHRLSRLQVTYTPEAGEALSGVTIQRAKATANINLGTGTANTLGATSDIRMYNDGGTFTAVIPAQDRDADGTFLTLLFADGTKKDYTLTAKKEFLAGHTTVIPFMGKELQYTFTVSPETIGSGYSGGIYNYETVSNKYYSINGKPLPGTESPIGLHGFNDRRLDNPGQGGQNNKGGGKPEYRSPKRQGPVYPGRIRKDLHPAGTTVLRYHAADLANQHNCGKHTRCRRKQGCHSRSQHLL